MSMNITSTGLLQLTINSSTFTASLLDNPTVSAFRSLLPLDLQMSELYGNEKYVDLPTTLPTAATNPGPIKAGDLMLYGSRTLVLWYEDYSTSYVYTRLGSISDSDGLAATVGGGEISVTFAMNQGAARNVTPTGTVTGTVAPSHLASGASLNSYKKKSLLFTSFLGLVHTLYR